MLLTLENWLLYHPKSHDRCWREPPPALHVEDVELTAPDGVPLHAWWTEPEGWRPADGAMLYCHGNAGNVSARGGHLAAWQTRMNQAVLIFDYPGYGRSGGRPSEAGCYAAADAALDWLTAVRGAPAERVVVLGRSLGAGVAVDLAARRTHRALVLYSPFTSFPDLAQEKCRWLPARRLLRNRFDNLAKIAAVRTRCSSPTARPTVWCRSTTAEGCSTPPLPPNASCRCRASATRAGSERSSFFRWADFLKIWRRADVRSVALHAKCYEPEA